MGGTGLMIYGALDPERLAPRPLPRSFLTRLIGRTRMAGPRVTPMGRNREFIQLDAGGLEPLIPRYREFLTRRLAEPNSATADALTYLNIPNIPSLYLRGEREIGNEPEWYTQIGFSGCAGMAEVSATLACHWAAVWAREEMPALERDIFRPLGFTPRPGQALGWGNTFLPVDELGYLRYLPPEEREDDGVVFEVDCAAVEAPTLAPLT